MLQPSILLILITIAFLSFLSFFHMSSEQANPQRITQKTAIDLYEDVEKLVNHLENEILTLELQQKQLTNSGNSGNNGYSGGKNVFNGNNKQNLRSTENGIVSNSTGTNPDLAEVIKDTSRWKEQLFNKMLCLYVKRGSIYLYHVRKAAGTTLRDILQFVAMRWSVSLYETEGVVLNPSLISKPSMLSIISLRNPISRIVSMYWYEHVGWFDGVLKQTNKCKPLRQWIDTWKDGSDFKRDFVRKNPKNVYVEISNYYTKILIGWDGNSKSELTEEDYLLAKKNLLKFDLVFITEWMSDSTQVDALNSLFPGRQTVAPGHKIRGDNKAKERLKDKLASDEEELKQQLLEMNKYDIRLFEFAQSLMAYRLKLISPLVTDVNNYIANGDSENYNKRVSQQCVLHNRPEILRTYKNDIGVFQPPGHKAPL